MYDFVLGNDYANPLPASFLHKVQNEQHPAKLMTLRKKRFVVDMETDSDAQLDSPLLKRISGDRGQARGMFENFTTDDTTAKGHRDQLPTAIREGEEAVYARMREVPFNVCFEGREEKDSTRS